MTELFIDNRRATPQLGLSLFDCAEAIGIQVPTSCVKQGKCRECILEVEAGEDALSPRTPEEEHLGDRFRLACRTLLERDADVRCHTMRRGAMRIVGDSHGLPNRPFSISPSLSSGYGIAADIGTTTIALRLYDLVNGNLVATHSFENPQRFGGSDVMARIHYDSHHKGRLLQRTLLGYLRREIARFAVPAESIHVLTVAANTTMRDLFFGMDVHSIGQKPYRSLAEHEFRSGSRTTTALSAKARNFKLPMHPDAEIYGLPLIGSHVGADAAACLLATGMADRSEISVLMDIGTNTELIMGNRDRIIAASCPAGPAFEGGGVLCGMPALDGAVERVMLTDDGEVRVEIIGDARPQGICGSGLVDVLSELRRTDRMNAQGRFVDPHGRFTVCSPDVVVSEADVNELAQAKGANVAGLRILADVFGIELSQIDRFYLAGGFALHLDVQAAKRIGLIPALDDDRIVRVGNAALEGAAHVLLSQNAREELERMVRRVEHIELETHPNFFDFFVEGCQFVPIGAEVLQ